MITVLNLISILMIVTVLLVIITCPAWIAGKVVALRTRVLPVPFFLRRRWLRWLFWYLGGLLSIVLGGSVLGASTMVEPLRLVLMTLAAIGAYAFAVYVAFYISWTASARRRARKERAQAYPPAQMSGGVFAAPFIGEPQEGIARLPEPGEAAETYAPPSPHDDDEYRPPQPTSFG